MFITEFYCEEALNEAQSLKVDSNLLLYYNEGQLHLIIHYFFVCSLMHYLCYTVYDISIVTLLICFTLVE